ncbi:hypothetical protein ABT071_21685 [Streptomyces sp. NPDC002506]|uniref:hypothetical protein n=1 Tax=Streptomyces sp. NPDC002506 TaxID=3154536 RepID=UPI0033264A55
MDKERPQAGDSDDPRALELARTRQNRRSLHARLRGSKPVPDWSELTSGQRSAALAKAAEWIGDAYQAHLLSLEAQLKPSKEQFAAIEAFLTARREELDASLRAASVLPYPVQQAAMTLRSRIIMSLASVRTSLYGAAEYDLEPAWRPSSKTEWAEALRLAEVYSSHADYAPETWTP